MSQTKIVLGHIQAHEKLTAKLFVQPTGESGYINLGNVDTYKYAPVRDFKKRMTSEKGYRRHTDTEVDNVEDAWEFVMDEIDVFNLKLTRLGTAAADTAQAAVAAPTGTTTFTSVTLGRTYFVGHINISTLVVKVGATTHTLGDDYTQDLDAGTITLLEDGDIVNGDTVVTTFASAAQSFQTQTGLDTVRFTGDVRLEEYNQHEAAPLYITTGTGTIHATAWQDHAGDFAKYTVRLVMNSKPTIRKRYSATA